VYLTQFLKKTKDEILEDLNIQLEFADYYLGNTGYISLDVWQIIMDELMEYLNIIVASFNYNYSDMKKKGESLYLELSAYVCHPDRIQRISQSYNMVWDTYLDCIDL